MVMKRSLFVSRKPQRETPHHKPTQQQHDDNGSLTAASLHSQSTFGSNEDNNMTVFRVNVPNHIVPGQYFQVYAGGRVVRVQCPYGYTPGHHLKVSLPNISSENASQQQNISGSSSFDKSHYASIRKEYHQSSKSRGPSRDDSRGSYRHYKAQHHSHESSMSHSSVPDSFSRLDLNYPTPHAEFSDSRRHGNGRNPSVQSPPAYTSPSAEQHHYPRKPYYLYNNSRHDYHDHHSTTTTSSRTLGHGISDPSHAGHDTNASSRHSQDSDTQLFEIEVPDNARPGAPFALMANGVRVLVNCPMDARPGQLIEFQVPREILKQKLNHQKAGSHQAMRLEYDKDGWTRRIRVQDMRFQWIRMDVRGEVEDTQRRFDIKHSAYVRTLELKKGTDSRFRQGALGLVPASLATCESRVKGKDGRQLVSYSDLTQAQSQSFEKKATWFHETCAKLSVAWNEGHMRIHVRRTHLLGDSVDAVMSLSRKDMRKTWRFEFVGEEAIDAGGLTREWFHLVTSQIFDPDMGLWQSSAANQMSMQINPSSQFCCEDHLEYYRFLGRVMGKALFDQQLCAGHMVQHMYKHLLGWPVTFADLETADAEYYNNLKQLETLVKTGQDLSMLCLDFTTGEQFFGMQNEIELVKGGANIGLTNDNFPEYLEACLKYKLMDVVKPQLNQLLLGFFDIIPEPLLTVFDFQELELLMCGLPKIDMMDWKYHTEYSGEYNSSHPVCQWFWEVVDNFDQEMKARLLQFVTGTSGVPSRGFAVLQGNDGDLRKFTIKAVPLGVCLYPRAHTCFNRIDLPMYRSKEELEENLTIAVTMCATGFDIE